MDVPTCERAKQLAEELDDAVTFYKIGLELMMSGEYFELLDWGNCRVCCALPERSWCNLCNCSWESFNHGGSS
jgi:hypothetical protein